MKQVDPELRAYITENILPRYDAFDKGHRRDHAETVIAQALAFCEFYDVDPDNGWEITTRDGKPSAQWEIMVLVTEDGHEVLSW